MKQVTTKLNLGLEDDAVLEGEIAETLGKEIAKEIDFEIISSILIEQGWTKVVLKPMTWEDGYAIDSWVETNIKGKFETMGLVWLFERAKDANWFKLRWLGSQQ